MPDPGALKAPAGNVGATVAIRVRMGVHVGRTHERGGDCFGSAVNRAARIADAGTGGQIVVSSTAIESLGGPPEVRFVDQGEHRLKDLHPESVASVTTAIAQAHRWLIARTLT